MFGRRHRFHGRNSLQRVYAQGSQARGQLISLKYRQGPPQKPYRVAVVVSKKVSKSAVVRNRIRRRIYAQVRQAEELIKPGADLVFTAYGEQLAEIDPAKLKSNINDLLKKAS
jgi:ribonuclease P protein component